MNDDKDWDFIAAIIGFFTCITITFCTFAVTKHLERKTAMENGYVECIVDGKILWKKSCTER